MKKFLSVLLCVIVSIAIPLTFSGCSEQKKFIGLWEGSIDLTDFINQGLAEDEEMAEYIEIDECIFIVKLTFNEDGTYKMLVEEDAAEKTFDTIRENMKKGIEKYFEDYIESMDINMTVEEVLLASDLSLDALVEEAFSDEMIDSIISEMSSEGNYEVKDGKLFTSENLDSKIDENVYENYEITHDELILLESSEEDDFKESTDTLEGLKVYPMTFKKIVEE